MFPYTHLSAKSIMSDGRTTTTSVDDNAKEVKNE
jgi:hypothetical protein